MKQRLQAWILAAFLLCGSAGAAFAQSTLWVGATDAKLKSEPGASSFTITVLEVGAKVEKIDAKGRWYKIRTSSGKEGWMYRGRLATTAPAGEVAEQSDLFAGLGGSKITSNEASTSRSIRGLSKETEAYAKSKGTPADHKQALETVLSWSVVEQKLEQFLASGKIGEYAE